MFKFIKFLLVVTAAQLLIALVVGFIAYEIEDYSSAICCSVVGLLSYITYNYLNSIVKFINDNNHN